jgi:hypothetical protein
MPQALKTIGHSSLVLIEGIRGAVLPVARTKACVSKGASPPLVAANFGIGAVYALGLDRQELTWSLRSRRLSRRGAQSMKIQNHRRGYPAYPDSWVRVPLAKKEYRRSSMRRSLDSWQLGMDGKLNRGEFTSKILKSAPRIRRRFAQLHRIFPLLMILHIVGSIASMRNLGEPDSVDPGDGEDSGDLSSAYSIVGPQSAACRRRRPETDTRG